MSKGSPIAAAYNLSITARRASDCSWIARGNRMSPFSLFLFLAYSLDQYPTRPPCTIGCHCDCSRASIFLRITNLDNMIVISVAAPIPRRPWSQRYAYSPWAYRNPLYRGSLLVQ